MGKARFLMGGILFLVGVAMAQAVAPSLPDEARHLFEQGNYKESYGAYKTLALSPESPPKQVAPYLKKAQRCLEHLNQADEMNPLWETAVETHPDNWMVLSEAARFFVHANHHGFLVSGDFIRGYHRGGGERVSSLERDRCRALQLLEQALSTGFQKPETTPEEKAGLYQLLEEVLRHGRDGQTGPFWKLQIKTDTSTLPDYEPWTWGQGWDSTGAPVEPDGTPLFYKVPESYEAAQSDGERRRWAMAQAMKIHPPARPSILKSRARFLHHFYGVQTLKAYSWFFQKDREEAGENEIFSLHTLSDTESLARLAGGIQRFDLPEDYNYIAFYRELEDWAALAEIYENRRQFEKAADCWEKSHHPDSRKRLAQIVGNWGKWEEVSTFPAGEKPRLPFRFRNGQAVEISLHRVDVETLLQDTMDYIESRPKRLKHHKIDVRNVGHRLVYQEEEKYLGRQVEKWKEKLEPLPRYRDRRVELQMPVTEAAVYLVKARMEKGNVSRVLLWMQDMVIVEKTMEEGRLYLVTNSADGAPLPDVSCEFFGYDMRYRGGNHYQVEISRFIRHTNEAGLVTLTEQEQPREYQWLVIATRKDKAPAWSGFGSIWHGGPYASFEGRTVSYSMTDRPVYRPGDTVQFKSWSRRSSWKAEGPSAFAGQSIGLRLRNPKGETVWESHITADEAGGVEGNYTLPADAPLGRYTLTNYEGHDSISFRVEEYKKPEFEVKLKTPEKQARLGDKISLQMEALYYHGGPVREGTARIRVTRQSREDAWFPPDPWDWLYGRGYSWTGYRPWYPWRPRPQTPPEDVLDVTRPVGADGSISFTLNTAAALALYGDKTQNYTITAEVTDLSRRTVSARESLLVSADAFNLRLWTDREWYRQGETVGLSLTARSADGKAVSGKAQVTLYERIRGKEQEREKWDVDLTDDQPYRWKLFAKKAGAYILRVEMADDAGNTLTEEVEFEIWGEGERGENFRFEDLELLRDQKTYQPGQSAGLRICSRHEGQHVYFFLRPANGVYPLPELRHLKNGSDLKMIPVTLDDQPNFFVEALAVRDGKLHTVMKQLPVPPESRLLDLTLEAPETAKPGEATTITVQLQTQTGYPIPGALALTVYDEAVEAISGGSNVPPIHEAFWSWKRHHHVRGQDTLSRSFRELRKEGEPGLQFLGVFGDVLGETQANGELGGYGGKAVRMQKSMAAPRSDAVFFAADAAPMAEAAMAAPPAPEEEGSGEEVATRPVTVRQDFADTAFWLKGGTIDSQGRAQFVAPLPENLGRWKIRAWAMAEGTRVGQAEGEITARKDLMLRLQAPRFFVEKDEVVLSAILHNETDTAQKARARLVLGNACLKALDGADKNLTLPAHGEKRVNWRVKAVGEGEAVVQMQVLTANDSDAMEQRFPVYVYGAPQQWAWSGVVPPEEKNWTIEARVPEERRMGSGRLEVRYSPTLAGAMLDALPYLIEYPYGCTEQTLNRFLPCLISLRTLQEMGVDLETLKNKSVNLNPQEKGDPAERARQWQHSRKGTPVFDQEEVEAMTRSGADRLAEMQLSDGGWGWFSGYGERSSPHTTAWVVRGLLLARLQDFNVSDRVISGGMDWLQDWQAERLADFLRDEDDPRHREPGNLDALVLQVLTEGGQYHRKLADLLYEKRDRLSLYGKSLLALALDRQNEAEKRDMVMRNMEQFLQEDEENQTAWLEMQNGGFWWFWYGNETETHAFYLKLLVRSGQAQTGKTRGLVKYLLNNRKNGRRWGSTRDTALCVEAFAEYLKGSGEIAPDLKARVYVDGRLRQERHFTAENLFETQGLFVLEDPALKGGIHEIRLEREGRGALYGQVYLECFNQEEELKAAGLEIKTRRRCYRLDEKKSDLALADKTGKLTLGEKREFDRVPLEEGDVLQSGDLVEVELEVESKNDVEYVVLEDFKAAGMEAVENQSGYNGNALGAYVEYRDNRTVFFVRSLARGKHSVSYRLRAEIPGEFSALPAQARAMYAPELRANSDGERLRIEDAPDR